MFSRLTFHRYHTVQEFNKGIYDYIIATDEHGAHAEADSDDEPEEDRLQDGVGDECR